MSGLAPAFDGPWFALRQHLRALGLPIPEGRCWPPGLLQPAGPTLVADDPVQARLGAADWVRQQMGRTAPAGVFGLVGQGLRSQRLRCFVAQPGLVLAIEQPWPLMGDDAEALRAAAAESLRLAWRAVARTQGAGHGRLLLLNSVVDGSLLRPAADGPLPAGRLPSDPLIWLRLAMRLDSAAPQAA